MNRYLSFSSTLLLGILLLGSCNSNEASVTPDNDPDQVSELDLIIGDLAQAQLNYRNHCGGCHGQRMESFVERTWQYGESFEEISASISDGYEENGMPGYDANFSVSEINDLALYILQTIDGKTQEDLEAENPDLGGIIHSESLSFRVETLTDEIEGIPWGIHQLPEGDLLVTERGGTLYRLSQEGELSTINPLPGVRAAGQGGLLDVAIHPNFGSNSFLYLSYSKRNPESSNQTTTAVARAQLQGNSLLSIEEIFAAEPYVSTTRHFGSRLLFDRDGYLYVSVGDRGERDTYPQVLSNHIGKVHRLHDDGTIPADNPFVDHASAKPSVYAYGIRNPQGLSLHPVTGEIWEGEHGPQGGDEINILEAGNNYGWPVISYGINYDGSTFTELTEFEGMEQPQHYWVPSIAPCGMDFISSDFYGAWQNDLLVSSLKFRYLHRIKMDGNEVIGHEELLEDVGRVRDVHQGQDGYLYIAVEGPGRVLRIIPQN